MSAFNAEPGARRQQADVCPPPDIYTPADRYQELFVDVQRAWVFQDSKTFVDCAPRMPPAQILAAYRAERLQPGFDLAAFVHRHFTPPYAEPGGYVSKTDQPLAVHIDQLWPVLTREPVAHPAGGSLLALPHAYLVPGGRFVELYYWDSYFTVLGLAGRCDPLVHAITDNFAYLIDTYGHVPNGNRTYYLSRSQPPVFSLMVELCEACGGQAARMYLPQLRQEHAWWMDGADALKAGRCFRRAVRLPGGQLLNRYWDDRDTPREESWREDVATAALANRPASEVYRDLRAAAESGWDFSTRWLHEPDPARPESLSLPQICTTRILPVDLNALMYRLETTIARLSEEGGDHALAGDFAHRAALRREAVDQLMWNESEGAYFDHDWMRGTQRRCLTAATVAPLFAGMASSDHASRLADTVRRRLLVPGGLATTECASGQQWDRPNGWAPLQYMAAKGFHDYGLAVIASEIRSRWMQAVCAVYAHEGRLVEKYNLRESLSEQPCGGGGGEYPLQDGFGWTNGVTRHWLPDAAGEAGAPRMEAWRAS
ncbi:MAG: Alpha,alpha-trehalase [Polaromonas sp.]|nr:Alpha,alpha-trehalase [Polaromonas sp.]